MEDIIPAVYTISVRIADIPTEQFENPAFSWHLVEVDADTKEVPAELVKPMSAEEWLAARVPAPKVDSSATTPAAAPTDQKVEQ